MAKQSRLEWLDRIRAVEREFLTARRAVDDFVAALESGAVKPPPNTKVRDVGAMAGNLEGTYLIRLFAAFESGLRSYWAAVWKTRTLTTDLIAGVAARRGVPDDLRDQVQAVRVYRNSLVHEQDEEVEQVDLATARRQLCTFFARLPDEW